MEAQKVGPYAPPENVGRVLAKVRQSGVRTLDTDFLSQLGIHVAMAPRTIRALEFLGFTDKAGVPAPLLQQYYAAATEDDAKALLANAIKSSYEIVWRAASPEAESREKIEQAFRLMEPAGQRNRMVTLFLGLCRLAGISVKDPPSSRPGGTNQSRPPRTQQTKPSKNGTETIAPVVIEPPLPSKNGVGNEVLFHPSIDAYLRAIRVLTEGDGWDQETRDRVVRGFETQLDLFLPVKKEASGARNA